MLQRLFRFIQTHILQVTVPSDTLQLARKSSFWECLLHQFIWPQQGQNVGSGGTCFNVCPFGPGAEFRRLVCVQSIWEPWVWSLAPRGSLSTAREHPLCHELEVTHEFCWCGQKTKDLSFFFYSRCMFLLNSKEVLKSAHNANKIVFWASVIGSRDVCVFRAHLSETIPPGVGLFIHSFLLLS